MSSIIVISADKLSQSMFSSYLEKVLAKKGKGVLVRDLNMLYTSEVQENMYSDFLKEIEEDQILVVKYKIKPNTNMEIFSLPPKIQEEAEYIVLFDMYSTHAEVLKDKNEYPGILDEWGDYIKRLS